MPWYVPITVIPGLGLIIISSSNLLIALNNEITLLNGEKEKYFKNISLKIQQLKPLNWAMAYLYAVILLFLDSDPLTYDKCI